MARDNANMLDKLRYLAENEPVRLMEMVRALLLSVPVVLGVTINAPVVTAVVTVVAIAVSVFGSKAVRDKVTPYWKVESGTYNQQVQESLVEYESSE